MRKWWWLVLLVIVVVGGIVVIVRATHQDREAATSQSEMETAVVERGTLHITVDGSGALAAQLKVDVPFETSGRVVEISVESGQVVETGQVLARLEDTDARRAVADAALQVRLAEVSLATSLLNFEDLVTWQADSDAVALAEANLAAANVDHRKTLDRHTLAGDQLTSAEVSLAKAQRALDDAMQAYDSAYDPGRDWELGDRRRSAKLEAEREAASDALTSARDGLAVAQAAYNLEVANLADSGVTSAWSKVLNAEKTLANELEGPDESELESARLQVVQQEIGLEKAKLSLVSAEENLSDTVLRAPAGGTVTKMDLALGQMVSNGQTGATISELETLIVEIGLDESDIAGVSLGQEAIVTLDAFDDLVLDGEITHIAPVAQMTSGVVLYDVTVQLSATELPARVGMTADVEVVTQSADEALLIPLKAVRSASGRTFVLRRLQDGEQASSPALPPRPLAGGQGLTNEQRQALRARFQAQVGVEGFVAVPVELGITTDAYAEVLAGLAEGDIVLLSSSSTGTTEGASAGRLPGLGLLGGARR